MANGKAKTAIAPRKAELPDGVLVVENGHITVNLDAIRDWVGQAAPKEAAALMANGLPILDQVGSTVRSALLKKMQERGQEKLPVGDGRVVEIKKRKGQWGKDLEKLKAAQATMEADGFEPGKDFPLLVWTETPPPFSKSATQPQIEKAAKSCGGDGAKLARAALTPPAEGDPYVSVTGNVRAEVPAGDFGAGE